MASAEEVILAAAARVILAKRKRPRRYWVPPSLLARARKWQTSPVSNPPLDNLKTFLQKRIRAIMAKEWWDFIVNVNTLNSDHASLLYSLANLCPSFNYFLQTREKELQLIIKKRPVVKPRIFSGTEKLDTTPEPIVPKQLPLVTRRNSATELVKILNELYPNENNTKSKQSRTFGPASKQKKPPGLAKKNALANTITGEVAKKTSPVQATVGRTPLLNRLLADESQKENAHINNVKKTPQLLSMPILLEDDETFPKAILSNTNYDLNQNRLNQSPRKVKKIIKVKKKRYVFSNSFSTDSKHRLKYILEDETPDLSLKLIKKYRIKKCTVDVVRLKDSVLKYYEDLRLRNCEKRRLSVEESSGLILNEEMKFTVSSLSSEESSCVMPKVEMFNASEATDQLITKMLISNSNGNTSSPPPNTSSPPPNTSSPPPNTSSPPPNTSSPPPNTSSPPPNTSSPPPKAELQSGKDEEVIGKNGSNMIKESASTVEKLGPRELKNMYCHGGIVPLGKLLMSDKVANNNKHFLSLKEKKMRDISNDAAIFLKPKDVNPKPENSEIETKSLSSSNAPPDLDKLDSFETSTKESTIVTVDGDKSDDSNDKAVTDENITLNDPAKESETVQPINVEQIRKSLNMKLDSNISSVVKSNTTDSDNVNETLVLNILENNSDVNLSNIDNDIAETTVLNSNGNLTEVSETSLNESLMLDSGKHLDIDDVELSIGCETSEEAMGKSKILMEIEKINVANDSMEITGDSLEKPTEANKCLEKLISDTLSNGSDELEPLAKRPRIEINLTEMKLVTDITKPLVELDSNDDRFCKMCKSSFESVESWNEHFENKVPKCTPNLQVTWDNPELSLLTD